MARVTHEFNCSNCPAIFDVKLNMALNGNYRIHCPQCKHIHFRKVEDGKITDVRFTENQEDPLLEDIWPMASSVKEKKEEKPMTVAAGFMQRLSKRVSAMAERSCTNG